ncbi:MAG: DEAD/DEAH box helicase [Clostridia bacterium]|nr:DEAD/DEAH box helicase [Clostridia bacterium]
MARAEYIFDRFPSFIKEFIYSHSWEALRDVQIAAAETLFESENNLLLTSSTASGKTEAAFFPILTELYENSPTSIGVLYVAPLKSLINDQFYRIEELLDETEIKVTHWHGDVAQSKKRKLLDHPEGILQITPESLEAMLINRHNDIKRLFGDLRYVVLDEVHTLTGTDRGNQIICQLRRIEQVIGRSPRRVGLSATVGSPEAVAKWLSDGTGRLTDVPIFDNEKIRWRLGMEHFYIQNASFEQTPEKNSDRSKPKATLDAGYEYAYDCVKGQKSLVFSNSREETEYVCATLRQIAKKRGERDIFLIHHGNLSAALREEAERKMKDEETHAVTCATVTMELGVDIGRLERILQIDSPHSVSAFLQRLGRSGRRGQPPEMMFVFREEEPLPNAPLPELIPWSLLQAIAIVQLYIEQRFIEPPRTPKEPYSLLFHQTLSMLASTGELSTKALAERMLSLPPFLNVPKEAYKALLVSMLNNDFLEMTEEKGLIVGLAGERLLQSFKFYAVFSDSEDYTVRCESEEIGTITTAPPVGDRFALAGRVWEVLELDMPHKLIFVKGVEGKMEVSWPGKYGEIHTKILERMKRVLEENTVYPYLKENARYRLEKARHTARNTGMLEHTTVHLGGFNYCMFPWLGTRSFRTLKRMLSMIAPEFAISGIESGGSCYITFRMEKGSADALEHRLASAFSSLQSTDMLVSQKELPVFEKYDEYVPAELLRSAFARDRLDLCEIKARIDENKRKS